MINKAIEENNPIKIKKYIFNINENKWKDESISNFVVGVTLTLLIYEVITHSYMNEKIGTRYRLISRSNTLKCLYISDNYYYKS
jgi:hypothetical protein